MKILSYNIHRGKDINKKDKIKQMIKYIKTVNCDCICLQEVLYHQFIKIKEALKMEGVFAANVNTKTTKYGICILTKYNIKRSDHIFISSKKEQRGLLCINISTNNKKSLNIINTHLGLDKEERNNQIAEILDFKNRLINPVIICGDLNDKNISINTYYDSGVFFKNINIATLPKYNARIDYIFVDKSLEVIDYKVDKVELSDHYPIICKI